MELASTAKPARGALARDPGAVDEEASTLEPEAQVVAPPLRAGFTDDNREFKKFLDFLAEWSDRKDVSVASGGGTGRTLHPDNMAAGPASYGMTDTLGRMHSDAQFAGSSSVPAHVEMMGLIGMGNNPMVGASVAVAVAIEQAMK